ncbi:acyl-CoA thioesterase II [Micropruina sp.]|uniref:acyl-CoA thioesterase n=1 Tax=Micropruina sp. TaxID=2737536 RepID=UPI00262286A8|nr:acyl-CoA thioesterase II [Micropruina sp.]
MPRTAAELVGLLELEQLDTDLFRGPQPETLRQRSFGGQVLAQALGAAYRTMAPERVAHSLNAYFLRPGSPASPILYVVEPTRDGRAFSQRRVVGRQNGRPIFSMVCSFHIDEGGLDHADPLPVGVPAPEDCRPAADVLGERSAQTAEFWEAEWGALDVRYATEPSSDRPGPAQLQLWIRTESRLPDDPRLHQMVLAYLSDISLLSVSTLTHPVEFMSSRMQAASIDHAMWFHRPARADEWLLYDQTSPSASGGLGFSQGRLFTADGVLAASCAQQGLIRVLDA